jgi:hypothetical protein
MLTPWAGQPRWVFLGPGIHQHPVLETLSTLFDTFFTFFGHHASTSAVEPGQGMIRSPILAVHEKKV